MRLRRVFTFHLIAVFLFLTTVEVLAHNHPLSQGENNSCPAYVLSNIMHLENVPVPVVPLNVVPFVVFLSLPETVFQPQLIFTCFEHRGPPVIS